MVWDVAVHALLLADSSPPHWLNAVQMFWFGGIGFSSAIVWYPFIKRGFLQVGSDIIGRVNQPPKQVQVISRIHIPTPLTSSQSDVESLPDVLPRPIYRIPARWQNETVNPYTSEM